MIPKTVHATWKSKDILTSNSDMARFGIQRVAELNPNWNVVIYDDNEVDHYLKTVMSPDDYSLIENVHIVEKSDLWRLYKLYLEGGVYIDIDRACNIPFDSLITDDIKWVLPTCRDFDFSHDFMMTEPWNPVFANTIHLYLQRRREGHTSVYFLGPQTYMHSITSSLFGQMINTDPGIEVIEEIRQELEKYPFIMTYREDPPQDTFIYRNELSTDDLVVLKKQLYADYGLRHWTDEW